ncbi:MAG: response regulator [Planctomycetia bacterium]|nr:response regulator [Planctomycetia bacterium]
METVLIVDDESSVRTTLTEWLQGSQLNLKVLAANDAAAALQLANQHQIDLAILDWNLGAGLNGLQLLEDLHEFQSDLTAILITGYASQATPLDALRLGIRDYLDKSHDLTKDFFLSAVRRQLEHLRPRKREREIHQQLSRFRALVQEALPRLETASVLHQDGIHLDEVARAVMMLAQRLTDASAGLLIVRDTASQNLGKENIQVFDIQGSRVEVWRGWRYAQSLAAAVCSMSNEGLLTSLASTRHLSGVQLSPTESKHSQLLGLTMHTSQACVAIVELFDKKGDVKAFDSEDKDRLRALQPMAGLLLKLVLGERESQRMLYSTLQAALQESKRFTGELTKSAGAQGSDVFRSQVQKAGSVTGQQVEHWADLLQRLSQKYGADAVNRIEAMLHQVESLLDDVTRLPSS